MIEALVLYTCLNALQGCKESQTAYYESSPSMKAIVEYNEVKLKNTVPLIMQEVLPVITFAIKGRATIKGWTFDPANKSIGYTTTW